MDILSNISMTDDFVTTKISWMHKLNQINQYYKNVAPLKSVRALLIFCTNVYLSLIIQ